MVRFHALSSEFQMAKSFRTEASAHRSCFASTLFLQGSYQRGFPDGPGSEHPERPAADPRCCRPLPACGNFCRPPEKFTCVRAPLGPYSSASTPHIGSCFASIGSSSITQDSSQPDQLTKGKLCVQCVLIFGQNPPWSNVILGIEVWSSTSRCGARAFTESPQCCFSRQLTGAVVSGSPICIRLLVLIPVAVLQSCYSSH